MKSNHFKRSLLFVTFFQKLTTHNKASQGMIYEKDITYVDHELGLQKSPKEQKPIWKILVNLQY